MTRRRVLVVVGVVVLIAAAVVVDRAMGGGGPAGAPTAATTSTTPVVRTDLAESTPVNGTIGYASPVSIIEPAGTMPSALTQAQATVATAQANVAADRQTLTDTGSGDAGSVTAAQTAASNAATQLQDDQSSVAAISGKETVDCAGDEATGPSGPCGTDTGTAAADQQKVTADQAEVQNAEAGIASAHQKATQDTDQAQAKLAADQVALTTAETALSTAETSSTGYQSTSAFTSLPTVGQVINPGQPLWSVDSIAVPLVTGSAPAHRAFVAGMGPGGDVAELDTTLIALGDGGGLSASDTFTPATAAAISRLQSAVGQPQTGSLPLGSVVFEPTAVRVTVVHAVVGAPVQAGATVLEVTSTTPVVNVSLNVDQTYLVKSGDAVSVNMPDGSTTDGTITSVGTVATNTTASGDNNTPTATVNVTVSLIHPSPEGSLDQAPVTVNITNASVSSVLAVPVTALLALAGGGYAVEVVDASGTHHLEGVKAGLFDDQSGMVQVDGSGLAAGQNVVVAS